MSRVKCKMSREYICKILHLYIKDFQNEYLIAKRHADIHCPDWREPNSNYFHLKNFSELFKKHQKVLEYLRKGKPYNSFYHLNLDNIRIFVYGKDTWRKNENQKFEIIISDFEKYEKIIKRELKLKRIIYGKNKR
jgi:hypothetical protein